MLTNDELTRKLDNHEVLLSEQGKQICENAYEINKLRRKIDYLTGMLKMEKELVSVLVRSIKGVEDGEKDKSELPCLE